MRNLILLCVLVFTAKSYGVLGDHRIVRNVIVRDADNDLVPEKRELKNLISSETFTGRYFKIVKGRSEDAVKIDDSLDADRAANVYYHLEKARDYFVSIGGKQDYQAVIRIEITNGSHNTFHFINDELEYVYNNARTITKGDGFEPGNIPAWGNEIWFRPAKPVKISDESKEKFKKMLRSSIPKNSSVNRDLLTFSVIEGLLSDDTEESLKTSGEQILTNYLRDSAIRWLVPEVATFIVSFQRGYLDAAYIPGIIYHEYTHLIMADEIEPVVNNPLFEGFADYFAIQVAEKKEFLDNAGDYASLMDKRSAERKAYFKEALNKQLGGDFVLSLFFEMEEAVNKLEGSDNYFQTKLYEMRKIFTYDSNISNDLADLIWITFPKYRELLITIMAKRGI